jgi:hypothetical protein
MPVAIGSETSCAADSDTGKMVQEVIIIRHSIGALRYTRKRDQEDHRRGGRTIRGVRSFTRLPASQERASKGLQSRKLKREVLFGAEGQHSLANRSLREKSSHLLVHEIETNLDGWDAQEAEAVARGMEGVVEGGEDVRGSERRGHDPIDHWVGGRSHHGVHPLAWGGVRGGRGHFGPMRGGEKTHVGLHVLGCDQREGRE